MLPFPRRLTLPLASLLILALPACSTPTTGLTSAADTARSIGHVKPSRADTCETQNQIAQQSSRIDTIITGSEKVYKADCKPAPAVVASNAKAG